MIHNKRRRARQIHDTNSIFLAGLTLGVRDARGIYSYRDGFTSSLRSAQSYNRGHPKEEREAELAVFRKACYHHAQFRFPFNNFIVRPWLRCVQWRSTSSGSVGLLQVKERLSHSADYQLKMQSARGYINYRKY